MKSQLTLNFENFKSNFFSVQLLIYFVMDSANKQGDQELRVSSKDNSQKKDLSCSQKSFNLGEIVDQKQERSKDMKCIVKLNERIYTRY